MYIMFLWCNIINGMDKHHTHNFNLNILSTGISHKVTFFAHSGNLVRLYTLLPVLVAHLTIIHPDIPKSDNEIFLTSVKGKSIAQFQQDKGS